MGDGNKEALKQLYEDLAAILDIYSGWLYDNLIRNIGWGIIQLLVWINDWIEGVADTVVSLGGLYDSPAMQQFMEKMQPLALALFVVSVTVLGFLFMLNKIEKRNEVAMNILVAVSMILVIPSLMGMMDDLLNVGLNELDESGTLSDDVLKRNIADVKYYVDSGFNYASGLDKDKMAGNENLLPHPPHPKSKEIGTTNYTYGNELENPETIEVNEKLNVYEDDGWFPWTTKPWVKELKRKSDNGGLGYDFLTKKLISTGDGGTRVVQLRKNTVPATNLGQQSYYRYHINWFIIIATLSVTAFALAITVIKIGRAMFDLAYHQLHGMFTAATDLTGGQRLKKVLTEIVSTFAVIFVMMVLLQMFIFYAQWANNMERHIGIVGVILLLIAGAWALIDAPDIIQRTMGIDAGLRSGYQAMMGGYAAGKMVGAGGKTAGAAAGKVVKTGGKTAGGATAGAVGASRGLKRNDHIKPIPSKDADPQYSPKGEGSFSTTAVGGDASNIPISIPKTDHSNPSPTASGSDGRHNQVLSPEQPDKKSGYLYPKDHKKHTLIGGSKPVQRGSHFMRRAHNTGYDVGEKVSDIRARIDKVRQGHNNEKGNDES
ncbi:pLS20_p028 family conjugation system transmembrane protein [Virgibacillus ihumii]|uniref:pLS20_p028 family conjugation system transmembrane protein n=1 Tax=Virgibacillus ihumii TaxID=2686091 RepID=UPI001FEB40DA|nr:hypothetical protein [Virgibacillus ihumii]